MSNATPTPNEPNLNATAIPNESTSNEPMVNAGSNLSEPNEVNMNAPAKSATASSPAAKPHPLDIGHKLVFPALQLFATTAGLLVAFQVFVVQRENADRNNREVEGRIVTLTAFGKELEGERRKQEAQQRKLDDQQRAIDEQQRKLNDTVRSTDERFKLSAELHKEHLSITRDLHNTAHALGVELTNQTYHFENETAKRFHSVMGYQSNHAIMSNDSLKLLITLQMNKVGWYTLDELALLVSIKEMTMTQNEMQGIQIKAAAEYRENIDKIFAVYVKKRDNADLQGKRDAIRNYNEACSIETERFQSSLNKAMEPINKKLAKQIEDQKAIMERLNRVTNKAKEIPK